MAKLAPIFNWASEINGVPANGAKLFTYAAGSTTKQTTYTDSAGLVPQANPIILDSRGEPTQPIWLSEGQSYKFLFTASTDTDPPTSPIRTIDNITGVNDSSITIDQWVSSGVTPTYVSPTSFTVHGDQTSQFQVNRRFKATVTSGTVYGYISASVFAALTTVTVVLDSGVLDSGLSSVQLGLITPINPSIRVTNSQLADSAVTNAKIADSAVTLAKAADDLKTSRIFSITAVAATNALTITLSPATLDYRSATLGSGSVDTVTNTSINTVISSGSTGGTTNGVSARFAVLAINDAGTIRLGWVNILGGFNLDESNLISTTAEGGAGAADSAGVIYSTVAVTSKAFRIVGYFDVTQATAGTWVTQPSKIQGYGGSSYQKTLLNAIGDAPSFACRAWINFNGQGTIAIRGSGNVSSITDLGIGAYTINFTTPMTSINYSKVISTSLNYGVAPISFNIDTGLAGAELAPTVNGFSMYSAGTDTPFPVFDPKYINAAVFA